MQYINYADVLLVVWQVTNEVTVKTTIFCFKKKKKKHQSSSRSLRSMLAPFTSHQMPNPQISFIYTIIASHGPLMLFPRFMYWKYREINVYNATALTIHNFKPMMISYQMPDRYQNHNAMVLMKMTVDARLGWNKVWRFYKAVSECTGFLKNWYGTGLTHGTGPHLVVMHCTGAIFQLEWYGTDCTIPCLWFLKP